MVLRSAAQRARLVLTTLAIVMPGLGAAQSPDQSAAAGLPLPDFKTEASLSATLAELDRHGETVIAEIGTHSVTRADIADAIRAMPPIASAVPFQDLYREATVQVMQRTALVRLAETIGLEKDPVVQRRMRNAADDALGAEFLRRSLAPNTTDAALRAVYDGVVAGVPGPEEVRARIIVVDTKAEATDLIKQLQGGADFGALARSFSKDGTAGAGGDLGYVRLDMLAPEIGSVIFALMPGQMTGFPVVSGNRWFVIRVEGRSQAPAPAFEEARPALERDIIHAGVPMLRGMALQNVPVRYHGPTGAQATK